MIQPVMLAGPWKGVYPSTDPMLTQKGYVHDAYNFRFRLGKATTIADLKKVQDLPSGLGTPISLETYVDRSGQLHTILIGSGGVWVGGVSSLTQVTLSNWTSPSDADITYVVVPEDEYLVVVNDVDPYIFYISLPSLSVTELNLVTNWPDMNISGAKLCEYFKSRLILLNLDHPSAPFHSPHMLAWSDQIGPKSFDLKEGAGTNPLTDRNGPIVGAHVLGDYLGIWQPQSLTVMIYTGNYFLPFEWVSTLAGMGCVARKSIQTIPTQGAVAYLGRDNFYITNGQEAIPKGYPVLDKLRSLTRLDDNSVLATNVRSTILEGKDEYWLIFDKGQVLAWNYAEDQWSIYKFKEEIIDVASGYVVQSGLRTIDLPGKTYQLQGRTIDLGRGTSSLGYLFLCSDGLYEISEQTITEGYIQLPEFRMVKPRTISRVVFRVDAPVAGVMKVRHSANRGETWSDWKDITIKAGKSVQCYYNILTTTDTLLLEVKVEDQPQLQFLDVVADVSVPRNQEVTMPRAGEGEAGLSTSL